VKPVDFSGNFNYIATMEADPTKAYNQDDATGFIRLNALRLKVAARVQRKK
jgi:argininosuccinate synthase